MSDFLRTLIVDVETVPIEDACDFLDEPTAPSNYKDPIKISDYVRDAKLKAIAEAGLDIDLARVVCLGISEYPSGQRTVSLCRTAAEEIMVLQEARELLEASRLITFCGARFDLPLLVRRYWYLGLTPLSLELDRYRSPHVDLFERLSCRGLASSHKLSWYCKRLGWLDCVTPLQGAEIAQAAREGRWEEIEAHCAGDLTATSRLAAWMGVRTHRADTVSAGDPGAAQPLHSEPGPF